MRSNLVGQAARAGAAAIVLCLASATIAGEIIPPNYIEVDLSRINDPGTSDQFRVSVVLSIPNISDFTTLIVSLPDESSVPLDFQGNSLWTGSLDYADLNSMLTAAGGFWVVETFTVGAGGNTYSDFSLDTGNLFGSFPQAATSLSPADGETDVPFDTSVSWSTDGTPTAQQLVVTVGPPGGGNGTQSAVLSTEDQSWDPPQELLPGPNVLNVNYRSFESSVISSIFSKDTSWGNSPNSPPKWPGSTPLLTLGSQALSSFEASAGGAGFEGPQTFGAAGNPNREATGDFNSDGISGDTCIVIPGPDPGMPGQVQVFLNNGVDEDGEWLGYSPQPPFEVGLNPTGVAKGQFNNFNDDDLDIAVTLAGSGEVAILLNDGLGTGTFLAPTLIPVGNGPSAIVATDFELFNTPLDLAVTLEQDEAVVILIGDGLGGFTVLPDPPLAPPLLGLSPVALFTDDFDGNKCPDMTGGGDDSGNLALPGAPGEVFVFLGNGDGTFTGPIIITVGAQPRDVTAGDFDLDGDPDIAVANMGEATVSIIENLGGANFAAPFTINVGTEPRAVDAVDLNGDGLKDLAVAADDPSIGPAVQVLINITDTGGVGAGSGPITFAAPIAFDVNDDPNFLVNTDVDADGLQDIVTVNEGSTPESGSVSVLITDLVLEVATCLGDLDGDGNVNAFDFITLISMWGPCGDPGNCPGDLDGSGDVGVTDLLMLLQLLGPCPGGDDPCPWDVNGDDVVDGVDLVEVFFNLGPCDDPNDCPWDVDGDDIVTLFDFIEVLIHQGPCPGAANDPGPAPFVW